jgi:NADH-quinone oxidoreductase subunit L
METTNLLSGVVLAPLVGAAILGFFGKRMGERLVGLIACATIAVSFGSALAAFLQLLDVAPEGAEGMRRLADPMFRWIEVGSFRAPFDLVLDPLSGVYVLFVTFVGFLIHVFATGYMHGEGGYYRFFAYLNLFMFNMLILILADNMLLMFVGWEGVGLCSYLLIGFYFRQEWPNSAAKKAFVVNRIGDVGFALAIMLTFQLLGTINFAEIAERVSGMAVDPFTGAAIFAGGLTTIAVLMFIGATGKSAQIPLFVWLPDAMAGPTPVSALIHAATMVTAGVYMVARTSEIYVHAPTAMLIVAIVGALTAVLAATIGLAQWDIKKVLAYSTVSQLGYMFLACGVGAFTAGVFHVVTHAFFKALLFLGSGSVILGMHHEQDMRRMGGLKKYMPITHLTMAVGWLAICGVPIFSGFFSKDEILYQTFATGAFGEQNAWIGKALWFVGAATAVLTAVYMTRLMALTFWSDERHEAAHGDHEEKHEAEEPAHDHGAAAHHDAHSGHGLHGGKPHESPISMTLPLVVLAVLAAFGGFLGVPAGLGELVGFHHNYIEEFMAPSLAEVGGHGAAAVAAGHGAAQGAAAAHHDTTTELVLTGISIVLAIAGILVGVSVFRRRPLLEMPRLFENKWYVDEIYDAIIVRPIGWLSRFVLWEAIDIRTIDWTVNGVGRLVRNAGVAMRYLHTGLVRGYVALILAGAAIVIAYFTFYGVIGR